MKFRLPAFRRKGQTPDANPELQARWFKQAEGDAPSRSSKEKPAGSKKYAGGFFRHSRAFAHKDLLTEKVPLARFYLVFGLLFTILALLVGRSFYLQVINDDFLQDKGASRYRRDLEISASRGRILDRDGGLLAVSTPMKAVWAIPADALKNPPEKLAEVASLLGSDSKTLTETLNQKLSAKINFVYLNRQLPPEIWEKIAALKVTGFHEEKSYRRFYPTADMTAHIVGFTGFDNKGQEGVELALQEALEGKPGRRSVIKDRRGQIVEDLTAIKNPQDGKDIYLTISPKVQYIAYTQLKQAVFENKAKAGGVVVLDASNGEVLALANWPTFNPNNRQQLSGDELRNRAITDTFEPGSTLKPLTAAMALDSGRFRPDTVINCAPGKMTIGPATISDSHPHGALTISQVIQKSSNIGSAKLALSFPPQHMFDMLSNVGFGQLPRIGFPGEVSGRVRPWKNWRPIEQATMSYGHGMSVSLIQLARAYLPFARDGDIVPLTLIRDSKIATPAIGGTRVFSQRTAREVRQMLESVVTKEGTAPKAAVSGYRVGGKTGTAYKLQNGEYVKKYVASFVGVAPISNPRIVVAVMLDEPGGEAHFGGDVAGPAFSAITGNVLNSMGVPPDGRITAIDSEAPTKAPADSEARRDSTANSRATQNTIRKGRG